MASTSLSSISGLASGIQWSDMIDQIISLETKRQLTPVTDRMTATQKKADAWSGYRSALQAFRDASKALADGTAFGKFSASVGASASGATLLTATAGSGAVAGSYSIQVLATASAEKLGSAAVSDVNSALDLSGSFMIGGRQVTIDAADSLSAIRDKINAANTGTNASHVSASILTVSSGVNRLILTNETTGSAGIELTENGGSNVLSSLGLVSANLTANTAPSGEARSYAFTTVTSTIAQALGVPMPSPSTFKVNGQTITVDLSQDSLSSIVAKINAAAGANTAKISSETVNGTTVNRIVVNGAVSADSADAANSTATLQQLGFLKNARSGEAQTVRTGTALTDASTGLAATSASLLTDLGAAVGDTLTFAGTRGDGSSVSVNVAVTGTTTMQDVLDALSASGTGFGATGRAVTASLDDQGRIQLTDGTSGDSKLSFSASSDGAGGGTLSFGGTTVATTGRVMQLAAPGDAQMRVDGVLVSRSTNTISDALAGVTLTLKQAEVGSTIDLTVGRDTNAVVNAVNALATAYNAAATYVSTNTAAGAALAFDSSLRSTITNLRTAMLGTVAGLNNTTYTNSALVGLTFDKKGQLTVDATALTNALNSKPDEVKALFSTAGTSALSTVKYMSSSASTQAGTYDVSITAPATTPVSSSSAFSTYGNAATANQMVVTDSFTGHTTTITLADDDTPASIVSKLNTGFGANALRLTASTDGTTVTITGSNYGSASSITVGFLLDGEEAAQQLGFATTMSGTDVEGTINGKAATGLGQLLTASAPDAGDSNPAQGLSLLYTGTIPVTTTMTFARAIGGMFTASADSVLTSGTGIIDLTTSSLRRTIDTLTTRQIDIQARLDRQRAALTAQFTAMESAMSKLQTQSTWLTGQINALSSLNSSSS
jgi:flagellar hook-associated protein 2